MSAPTLTPGLLSRRAAAHVLNKLTMTACAPVMTWQAIAGRRGRHTRRANSFRSSLSSPLPRVAGNFPKRFLPALGAFILACTPAEAQRCGARENVVAALAEGYGETPLAIGLTGNGKGVIEVYSNRDTGTVTVILTTTGNLACIIAAGTDFHVVRSPSGVPM